MIRRFRTIVQTNVEPQDKEVLWLYKRRILYFDNGTWRPLKFIGADDVAYKGDNSTATNVAEALDQLVDSNNALEEKVEELEDAQVKAILYYCANDADSLNEGQKKHNLDAYSTAMSNGYATLVSVNNTSGESVYSTVGRLCPMIQNRVFLYITSNISYLYGLDREGNLTVVSRGSVYIADGHLIMERIEDLTERVSTIENNTATLSDEITDLKNTTNERFDLVEMDIEDSTQTLVGEINKINEKLTSDNESDNTSEAIPGLLRNEIDDYLLKLLPMSSPLDQITRCRGAIKCNSMVANYYPGQVKEVSSALAKAVTAATYTDQGNGLYTYEITVRPNHPFKPGDTILFPTVNLGTAIDPKWLVAYVVDVSDQIMTIAPVNSELDEDNEEVHTLPDMMSSTRIIRMEQAPTESGANQVTTQPFPKYLTNNCQIFKVQVYRDTLKKIIDKEENWRFSQSDEESITDMRRGMEKNFLFGASAHIFNPQRNDYVYMTDGIWNQTENSYHVEVNSMTEDNLVEIYNKAFESNNGSKYKVLLGGSKFINTLINLNSTKVEISRKPVTKWGINFYEVRAALGVLYVAYSEAFDQCIHSFDAIIIDPNFIDKYTYFQFNAETAYNSSTSTLGALTEACCLVLRYPNYHIRIINA